MLKFVMKLGYKKQCNILILLKNFILAIKAFLIIDNKLEEDICLH